ncbi:hypothetical protein RA085_06935 [Staphylococcus saprophyticus]|uniref:hypothetical protein n=1 Tax=Staphylococcus saprophyticus TaxID=29385 RepID=UPI0027B8C694|nr:hypothetical protein [Staphylococcus saprophyticus]WLW71536.1 hypothetical protein RA083_06940 [Staphylococcus saprophyticus]WLW73965.1 hypothetical protein RA085_06935 [Staphylococcus saprophyticus]
MSKESVSLGAQWILNDILEQIDDALATDSESITTLEIFNNNDELTSRKEMNKTEYLKHTLEVIREQISDKFDLDEW